MALSPDQLLQLVERHDSLEQEGNLDGVLETLVEEPEYMLWNGRTLRGRENVREFYRRGMQRLFPRIAGGQRVRAATGDSVVISEDEFVLDVGGEQRTIRTVTVIPFRDDKMTGEQVWTSRVGADTLDEMFGDLSDITTA